jgi:transcription initiation factor TFIID subunit 10
MAESGSLPSNPSAALSNAALPVAPNDAEQDLNNERDVDGEQSSSLQNGVATQDTAVDVVMADQQPNGLSTALAEARIPAKKDANLREFLSKMDEHAPIVWRS